MKVEDNTQVVLAPTKKGEGMAAWIICLLTCPLIISALLKVRTGWQPIDRAEAVLKACAIDVLITLVTFQAFGLVWLTFSPRWMAPMVQGAFGKVKFVVALLIVGMACSLSYVFGWHR